MSNKLSWMITALAVVAMCSMYWLQDQRAELGDHIFRPVAPLKQATEAMPGREIVPVSETVALQPGQLVDIAEFPIGEINIQKLTDNSYWILHNLHAMTLYIGEHELLLVDAADGLFADRLLNRIAKLTDKPLTTLVYSHPHLDHIVGAQKLVDAVAERGWQPLRIIASEQFVRASQLYQQTIPQPTEVLATPVGYFEFDGKRFKLGTPVTVGHSTADSYVLFPDKVITFIDYIYANRLPLHDYSGVQNMTGYITFLRHVAGEDWLHANTGHNNISGRRDLDFTLQYTKDLFDAWFEVVPDNWGVPEYLRGKMKDDNIAVWLRNIFDRVAYQMAEKLEPKYGHIPQFELALDHALKVHWDGFLHYDFQHRPDIRPEFTPIKPQAVIDQGR
jgi:glyoxylase-like metal-dependent hydrolase (beta-lactamase superfamily II)